MEARLEFEAWVGHVMAKLHFPVPEDAAGYVDMLRTLHREGFTVTDAVAYSQCMEECNPELDEDVALARMDRIRSKYECNSTTN